MSIYPKPPSNKTESKHFLHSKYLSPVFQKQCDNKKTDVDLWQLKVFVKKQL